jgi:site-specific recombinase XerD
VIAGEHLSPGSPVPTTHWARHTTATVLMELGVDAKIIGEIVGHQSEAVPRRYQHVPSAAARDGMDKLGSHFALASA